MMGLNKKGNIPITILVIGVVAICILALGSFAFSVLKLNSHSGLGIFEDIQSDVDKFYFYINAGLSEEEAALNVEGIIQGNNLVIKRINKNIKINYNHKIKIKPKHF